ncbi:zinc ribbon-containing protein [Colwellia sp. E2M01]|uniref:zinc ribbon-containing protein n=1 Tax=Colwellia sp. E2M01 TaxID=2841561 RepID=UPI001C0A5B74|nr:zinc ribbon-containing protein [Colwellia sp. E2M01]MBU2871086.1 zinc ribbon-containing protein [Colwellia sp. E2M01]
MSQQNDYFADVYKKLNNWLVEMKIQQKPNIDEFIKQAKLYAGAIESMSEEKLQQFTANLKYDLHDFYQLNKNQAEHSVYLGLLNEALWENLAKLTDKSQVEWAELVDDFDHDGVYKSGDFIGFGELQCEQCDAKISITHFSEINDCAHCGSSDFIRQPLNP